MLFIKQVQDLTTGEYQWILFEHGEFMRPLAIVFDHDMRRLVESYQQQLAERKPGNSDPRRI